MKVFDNQGKYDNSNLYQIRVKGYLEESDGLGFRMEYTGNGDTILIGKIVDQAALHGVLKRFRDLGIPLISVVPVNDEKE